MQHWLNLAGHGTNFDRMFDRAKGLLQENKLDSIPVHLDKRLCVSASMRVCCNETGRWEECIEEALEDRSKYTQAEWVYTSISASSN